MFKHWKELDISPVNLNLNREYTYYIQSRAWGLKGWLGGTHPWMTFFSKSQQQWLVVELTDQETVEFQKGHIYFQGLKDLYAMTPIISSRDPEQMWFSAIPKIVDQKKTNFDVEDVRRVCASYPYQQYRLLTRNCNTFFSYLNYILQTDFRRPLRSVGYRETFWWDQVFAKPKSSERRIQAWELLKYASLLIALSFFALSSEVKSSPEDLFKKSAKDHYAQLFSVDSKELEDFFITWTTAPALKEDKNINETCVNSLKDPSLRQRQGLLQCLKNAKSSLNSSSYLSRSFSVISSWNFKLQQQSLTDESEKTILLNNYLLDLFRSRLAQKQPASWWIREKTGAEAFMQSAKIQDFPFEDGDLILAYGGAGSSGLVEKMDSPAIRMSHAVIIKKKNGLLSTMESLPHTGAQEFSFEHFLKENYHHMLVLRWKNGAERNAIAKQVSQITEEWTLQHRPFDPTFSSIQDNSMYCTLMASLAYAKASRQSLENFLNHNEQKKTSSVVIRDFAQDLGVGTGSTYVSPSALLRSPSLQVVAEYRDTDNLFQSWEVEGLTSLTLQKYAQGDRIKPYWLFRRMGPLLKIPYLSDIEVLRKSRELSKMIGFESFLRLATYEKKIVSPTLQGMQDYLQKKSFSEIPLWDMYAQVQSTFETVANGHLENPTPTSVNSIVHNSAHQGEL